LVLVWDLEGQGGSWLIREPSTADGRFSLEDILA